MKVVVHDYGGYPFIFDISKELARKGCNVYHIFSSSSGSPSANFKNVTNLTVLDLGKDLEQIDKNSFVKRFKYENSYGELISRKIDELKPDIVFSSNTPLLAQKKIADICSQNGVFFVHWLQDLLSIAAKNVIKKKNHFLGLAIGYYFEKIEKYCFEKANHIISISDDFTKILLDWGVSKNKITKIENWSNLEDLPLRPKINDFSLKHNLTDTFNIVYSGTLGMKQNPSVIINTANKLRGNAKVKFVIVAIGAGVEYIKEEIQKQQLDNILLLPLQPFSELPNVLASGDLLIGMLDYDASVYCVPSKVLTYYCSGRPSLLVLSKENLAARTTLENGLGFVIEPNNIDELYTLINKLVESPLQLEEYGKKARDYAELNFSSEKIIDHFIKIIDRVKI